MEFRLSNFNASGYGIVWNLGSSNGISRITVALNGGNLVADTYRSGTNTGCTAPLGSRTDIRVRVQQTGSMCTVELWDGSGANYSVYTANLASRIPAFDATGAIRLFGNYADGSQPVQPGTQLHFLRLYSSIVAANSAPPPDLVSSQANLLSYGFDGNLTDLSPQQVNLRGSRASYSNSALYPPIAVLRTTGSAQTGSSGQLDASDSFASGDVDGIPVMFQWQCLNGPGPFTFVPDAMQANPVLQMPLAGDYQLQLTITDVNGLTATATGDMGSVSTDQNGRVISPFLSSYDSLLLPLTSHGTSPWPFFDNEYLTGASLLSAAIPTTFEGDNALAGTVTARINSSNIVGNGTHFLTDFAPCDGNEIIVFQYPLADGTTGRRAQSVQSCADDTHMVVGGVWWRSAPDPGSGPNGTPTTMAYGKLTNAGQWVNGSDNWNYYDVVTALYREWVRTGLNRFRDAARNLASIYWRYPVDKGVSCQDVGFACSPPRVLALQGIILYFLESGNATPGDWNDMYKLAVLEYNGGYGYRSGLTQPANSVYQAREDGFVFWWLALLAKYYPAQYDASGSVRADLMSKATDMYHLLRDRQQNGTGILGPASQGAWVQNEDGNGYGPTQPNGLGYGSLPWHAFAILHGMRVFYDLSANNPALRQEILGVVTKAAAFLNDQAWNPDCLGTRYSVLYQPNCAGGACQVCKWSGGTLTCSGVGTPATCPPASLTYPTPNRAENEPVSWLWGWLYSVTGNSKWVTIGDARFAATFGGGQGGPGDDGGSGTFADLARYGTSSREGKTMGESAGNGAAAAYLAWRLGPPQNEIHVPLSIVLAMPDGAASARITVIEPSGTTQIFNCASSPCAVQYDGRQTSPYYKIEYLSPAGTVLPGNTPLQKMDAGRKPIATLLPAPLTLNTQDVSFCFSSAPRGRIEY